jgi:predicted tellurium resistance membrane protein TerC
MPADATLLQLFTSPEAWIALITLAALEIVLGIDNIVFIAVLTDRLPESRRRLAFRLGLGGAMFTRIGLLLAISWVMGLTANLFTLLDQAISGRDLILLAGGMFLIGKSAHEIYRKVERLDEEERVKVGSSASMSWTVAQIMVLDIVFSLDSVITAVGMVKQVSIMIIAIVIAIGVMLLFANRIGSFINRNPTMKILALSFLLLIGVLLTAEAFDQHINKGYIYFAMGFAVVIEMLNMRFRRKRGAIREEVE